MTERPILFSGEMVRAILAGRKKQTRRLMNPQPWFDPRHGTAAGLNGSWMYGNPDHTRGDQWSVKFDDDHRLRACTSEAYGWGAGAGCRYGVPGDRLWVREGWVVGRGYDGVAPRDLPPPLKTTIRLHHMADGPAPPWAGRGRPGIHMPRWASRLLLDVAEVRVERLCDISDADARAEGFEPGATMPALVNGQKATLHVFDPVKWYQLLWDRINGARAPFNTNPWVWVVRWL